MISLVVDTNALLRFLLNDIPSQVIQVQQKIEQAKLGKYSLVVPQIVVFEIAFALTKAYGFPKIDVAKNLKKIITSSYLQVDQDDIFTEALDIYRDKNLSLPDCFIKIYAKRINAQIFTFDKNLEKLNSDSV